MKTATVTEAKARLSQLLGLVGQGETILILSRGKPVARLEPIRKQAAAPSDVRLEHLARHGLVRRAAAALDPHLLDAPGGAVEGGRGLLDALLAEREEGR